MPNCPSRPTAHNTNVCVSLMFSVWRPCVWHYDVDRDDDDDDHDVTYDDDDD